MSNNDTMTQALEQIKFALPLTNDVDSSDEEPFRSFILLMYMHATYDKSIFSFSKEDYQDGSALFATFDNITSHPPNTGPARISQLMFIAVSDRLNPSKSSRYCFWYNFYEDVSFDFNYRYEDQGKTTKEELQLPVLESQLFDAIALFESENLS